MSNRNWEIEDKRSLFAHDTGLRNFKGFQSTRRGRGLGAVRTETPPLGMSIQEYAARKGYVSPNVVFRNVPTKPVQDTPSSDLPTYPTVPTTQRLVPTIQNPQSSQQELTYTNSDGSPLSILQSILANLTRNDDNSLSEQ